MPSNFHLEYKSEQKACLKQVYLKENKLKSLFFIVKEKVDHPVGILSLVTEAVSIIAYVFFHPF